jgi:hypothetical protein
LPETNTLAFYEHSKNYGRQKFYNIGHRLNIALSDVFIDLHLLVLSLGKVMYHKKKFEQPSFWRYNPQHNEIQHNNTQHIIILSVAMLSAVFKRSGVMLTVVRPGVLARPFDIAFSLMEK